MDTLWWGRNNYPESQEREMDGICGLITSMISILPQELNQRTNGQDLFLTGTFSGLAVYCQ